MQGAARRALVLVPCTVGGTHTLATADVPCISPAALVAKVLWSKILSAVIRTVPPQVRCTGVPSALPLIDGVWLHIQVSQIQSLTDRLTRCLTAGLASAI